MSVSQTPTTHITPSVPPAKEGFEAAMLLDSLKCAWLLCGLLGHELFEMLTAEIKQAAFYVEEAS
jgi:hypothetical protein